MKGKRRKMHAMDGKDATCQMHGGSSMIYFRPGAMKTTTKQQQNWRENFLVWKKMYLDYRQKRNRKTYRDRASHHINLSTTKPRKYLLRHLISF